MFWTASFGDHRPILYVQLFRGNKNITENLTSDRNLKSDRTNQKKEVRFNEKTSFGDDETAGN